jgi:hypothetical protein
LFILPKHFDYSLCLQAPCSLNQSKYRSNASLVQKLQYHMIYLEYNHFEIVLLDQFSNSNPPPGMFDPKFNFLLLFLRIAIALCTASPLDPLLTSQFKQDYLRFWPTGDGK